MGNGLVLTGFSPALFSPQLSSELSQGITVVRPTANLPQTAAGALFTISGGLIKLVGIYGVVTTVIQTQANNTKLVFNPTAGADVDMCAVLDITAKAVGTVFSITGVVANALVNSVHALAQATPHILMPGSIDLNCAAANTGQVKWVMTYLALEPGATVAAA